MVVLIIFHFHIYYPSKGSACHGRRARLVHFGPRDERSGQHVPCGQEVPGGRLVQVRPAGSSQGHMPCLGSGLRCGGHLDGAVVVGSRSLFQMGRLPRLWWHLDVPMRAPQCCIHLEHASPRSSRQATITSTACKM